ncbi:U32 family peptidase [Coxiella burnetii]|uniref:U32 family peptidase n=1 Tax=Coxiella burnetii TaxID=777 RepID=UPI00051F18AD|nr:U32 family peptidase [Coxiella burnetii]AIT62851.1 putative peptidase [Coxiella burnetii str. Namibia]
MDNHIIRSAARARKWLQTHSYPYSDEIPLTPSLKEVEGGGHYALEIPAVTSLEMVETIIRLLKAAGIEKAVLGETHGSFLLTDSEIKEMLSCCAEAGFGMIFSPGPRPEYYRKATFYRSQFGIEQGRRLNNNDAIACTVEDVFKLTDFGCRGIVIYDLGILKILNEMRTKQVLPNDLILVASTHCTISNSVTASVFANLGADQIVALHDVGLSVLQDMRRLLPSSVTLSVPIDTYETKGGFIRYYEIPEILQIASPVFLKLGASAQAHPYNPVSEGMLKKRIERVVLGVEQLKKSNLAVKEMSPISKRWCLPQIGSDRMLKISESLGPVRHLRNEKDHRAVSPKNNNDSPRDSRSPGAAF